MKVRDLVHINFNYSDDKGLVITSGIVFNEFFNATHKKPKNLLLLSDGFMDSEFDQHTRCEYYPEHDINKLVNRESSEIYHLGDFHWIDFANLESLHKLNPMEIAELYYISKKGEPLNSYYFDKIDNNYIYLAHDDGFISFIWFKNVSEFHSMLGKIVSEKISLIYDLVLEPFDENVSHQLRDLSNSGVFLGIDRLELDKGNSILIPVYCIEETKHFDDMLSKAMSTKAKYFLKYYKNWEIIGANHLNDS